MQVFLFNVLTYNLVDLFLDTSYNIFIDSETYPQQAPVIENKKAFACKKNLCDVSVNSV